MFKRRIILFIILLIALISGLSFFLLLHYYDPYENKVLALTFFIGSIVLSFTSMVTLFLYMVKKIYYRGEVGIYHIRSSIRQSFFVCCTCISAFVFLYFHIPYILPTLLVGIIFLLLEFLIQ